MTGPLKNPKHERFAQAIIKGETLAKAYVTAGYAANEKNAARLKKNEGVEARLAELHQQTAELAKIDAAYVLKQAVKLHEKCMANNENGTAARALELVGKHVSVKAFQERIDHSGRIEYSDVTEEELDARLAGLAHDRRDSKLAH